MVFVFDILGWAAGQVQGMLGMLGMLVEAKFSRTWNEPRLGPHILEDTSPSAAVRTSQSSGGHGCERCEHIFDIS